MPELVGYEVSRARQGRERVYGRQLNPSIHFTTTSRTLSQALSICKNKPSVDMPGRGSSLHFYYVETVQGRMARHLHRATGEPATMPQKSSEVRITRPFHRMTLISTSRYKSRTSSQAGTTADSGPFRDFSRSDMERLHVLKRSASNFTCSHAPSMLFTGLEGMYPAI